MRSFKNAKKKRELEEQRRRKALQEKEEEEEEDFVAKIKAKAKRAASEAVRAPSSRSGIPENVDIQTLKDPPSATRFDAVHGEKQQSSPIRHTAGRTKTSWTSKASATHKSPKHKWLAPSSSFSPSSPPKLKFDNKWLNPNKKRRPFPAPTTTSENVDVSSPPSTPPLHSQSPQRGRKLNWGRNSQDDDVENEEQKKRPTAKSNSHESDSSDTDVDDEDLLACFGSNKNKSGDSRRQSKSECSNLKAEHRNSNTRNSNNSDKMVEDDPIADSEDERMEASLRGRRSTQKRMSQSNSQSSSLKSDSSDRKPAAITIKKKSSGDDSSVSDMELDNVRRRLDTGESQSQHEGIKDVSPSSGIYAHQNVEQTADVLENVEDAEQQRRRSKAEAELWSDSEDDKKDSQHESPPAKKKRRSSSVDKSEEKPKKRKKRSNSKNSRRSTSHSPRQHADPVLAGAGLLHLGEDELRNTLHPTFDKPKFGPFDVGPLVLSNTKDGDGSDTRPQHQVPASINRYLLDYQREGIQFMYNTLVTSGMGAVLGDDMVCKVPLIVCVCVNQIDSLRFLCCTRVWAKRSKF